MNISDAVFKTIPTWPHISGMLSPSNISRQIFEYNTNINRSEIYDFKDFLYPTPPSVVEV